MRRVLSFCSLMILLAIVPSHESRSGMATMEFRLKQLTPGDREAFYHSTQGSKFIPYTWFLNLERHDRPFNPKCIEPSRQRTPDCNEPKHIDRPKYFKDDLVERYGFVRDRTNPDGLPVGFAKKTINGDDYFGINCAACHTGRLTYRRRPDSPSPEASIRIDGGASMHNNQMFFQDMAAALADTFINTEKFARFAQAVLPNQTPETMKRLRLKIYETYDKLAMTGRIAVLRGMHPTPVLWGPGRVDANGRGANAIFAGLDPENIQPVVAPASIPNLWDALTYDWGQWNGSIQNPMARNVAPTLSLGLDMYALSPTGSPNAPLSVDTPIVLDEMNTLEKLVWKIQAPVWPFAEIGTKLGMPEAEAQRMGLKIDKEKALRGKALFVNLCQRCHIPGPLHDGPFGQKYKVKMLPIEVVGTDPAHAVSFYARRVRPGLLKYLTGKDIHSGPEAVEALTTLIMEHPPNGQPRWAESRPNGWRAPLEYIARPLNGIWATPPYLHNGSVPNIYELLSPLADRSKTFCAGDLDYDPAHVGFRAHGCEHEFDDPEREMPFDTTIVGNLNNGHEFTDAPGCQDFGKPDHPQGVKGVLGCKIKEDDRMLLVEYLKTCDLKLDHWNLEDPRSRKTAGPKNPDVVEVCASQLEDLK